MKDLRSDIDSSFSFPNFKSDDGSSTKSTLKLPPTFDNSVNDINDKVNENSNNKSTHKEVLCENTASAFDITNEIVDWSETMPQRGQVEKFDIDKKMVEIMNHCIHRNLSHPVEIMNYLQS